MLKTQLHRATFITILREIYADPVLRISLGFKGGTAAMLFYDLPRFSVDLDFDLIDPEKKEVVYERLKQLLQRFGTMKEATDKHFTLFFLLNYGKRERNIKIEISKRPVRSEFVPKKYLGISVLVMREPDMLASKLAALLTRKRFAMRDVFDVWFFLKNNWLLDENLLQAKTGMSVQEALEKAQKQIQSLKSTELLAGLGELLDDKQKTWVKDKLIEDTLFYLRLYQSEYRR